MPKINYQKATGDPFGADDTQEIKDVVNAIDDDLANKASKVNGQVPLAELPEVVFSGGITGAGTEQDPYVIGGGLSAEEITAYFQSLPNWAADRVLQGDMTWIDPPQGGDQQKLDTPNIVFGTPLADAIPISWNTIPFGVNYSLQRDTSIAFASPVNVYSGPNTSFTDVGLTPSTNYFYRLRVTASGFASSNYDVDEVTTDVPGNVTPVAPTIVGNDNNNTLAASHALGASEIVMSVDDASYVPYTGQIAVGNVIRPVGYWKFKIKSATGRNESPVANSPAFTETQLTKPAAPTAGVVNDTANTFNFTYTPGYTTPAAYERRIRNTETLEWGNWTILTAKPIVIGDISVPAGYLEVRVRAVNNVSQASEPLTNVVDFIESAPDLSVPVTSFTQRDNIVNYNEEANSLSNAEGIYAQFDTGFVVEPGAVGYIQFSAESGMKSGMIQVTASTFDYNGLPQSGMALKWDYFNQDGSIGNKCFATGKDYMGGANFYEGGVNLTVQLGTFIKCRIRFDGTHMIGEYFNNEWIQVSKKVHGVALKVGGTFPGDTGVDRPRTRFIRQYGL